MVIVVGYLITAGLLFRSTGSRSRAYRTLGVLALAGFLGASWGTFAHLGAMGDTVVASMSTSTSSAIGFPFLKTLAAVLWMIALARLPGIVSKASRTDPFSYRGCRPDVLDLQADIRKAEELAKETERLGMRARMLEILIRNESWLLDQVKVEERQELVNSIDDREMIQCQI